MNLKEIVLRIPVITWWKRRQQKKNFKGSAEYWESRYRQHGNSGSGSYQHLAEFKAEILNEFVAKHNISTVLEFGCGDGNQLTLAKYPQYVGLDVSATAIQMCIDLFKNDRSKSFYLYNTKAFQDHAGLFNADLALSLDVLFHLVEPEIFELYLRQLFESSKKYVIIYASDFNHEGEQIYQHDRRRNFTAFVDKNMAGWRLMEVKKNKYPVEQYNDKGSYSDFYIYGKS